jgi:Tfp pilus assembly protein PilV
VRSNIAGFSLIEALVTLLVLSTGLLALGQLQARLWLNAAELHTGANAGLLAANLMETAAATWLPEAEKNAALTQFQPIISAVIRVRQPALPGDSLSVTDLNIRWASPSAVHSVSLGGIRNARLDPLDTRWLFLRN